MGAACSGPSSDASTPTSLIVPRSESTAPPSTSITPSGPSASTEGFDLATTAFEVIDGDTFDLFTEDGAAARVRLIGVDTPERGECFHDEARAELRRLLDAGPVTTEVDVSDVDQFGRSLRYVFVDGTLVKEQLVRDGFAIARRYPPDTGYAERLEAAQDDASSAERGLWAPDACGQRMAGASSAIVVVAVEADAPGDDAANLNGEWVEIANQGTIDLELTGWTVRDESSSHRYAFPDGFTLAAGTSVRILSGCGEDSTGQLHWCERGSAVWNNNGDTAFVRDPAGNIVSSLDY